VTTQSPVQVGILGEPAEDAHPSFVLALVSVFAASFVVALLFRLLLGFTLVGVFPHVDVWVRLSLGSLVGAWVAQLALRVLGGYRLPYVAAVCALLAGSAVTYYLNRLAIRTFGAPTLPFFFTWGTVVGVIVSTWLLQLLARRRTRRRAGGVGTADA
jgi:uncharacterized membrane protein